MSPCMCQQKVIIAHLHGLCGCVLQILSRRAHAAGGVLHRKCIFQGFSHLREPRQTSEELPTHVALLKARCEMGLRHSVM